MGRRDFLKVAAGLGAMTAVVALPGCAPQGVSEEVGKEKTSVSASAGTGDGYAWLGNAPEIDESQIVDTVTTDVVVLGGGNAGVMCACAAAEAGATVSVVEMQSESAISYYGLHDIATLNSNYLTEHGIEAVKPSEFIAEYQRRNRNKTNPALVRQFANHSGEMLDWLISNAPQEVVDALEIENGIESQTATEYFNDGAVINGFRCWRGCTQVNFQDTAPVLIAQAENQGATWYWEHTAVKLLTETVTERVRTTVYNQEESAVVEKDVDTEVTRVTGAIVQDANGEYHAFVGEKGVVLACGDYGGNNDMYVALQDERRWLYEAHGLDTGEMRTKMFGRDGSGIKMGMWAGGSIDPCPHCLVSPQVMFESNDFPTNVLRWGSGFKVEADRLPAGSGGASQNPWALRSFASTAMGDALPMKRFLASSECSIRWNAESLDDTSTSLTISGRSLWRRCRPSTSPSQSA